MQFTSKTERLDEAIDQAPESFCGKEVSETFENYIAVKKLADGARQK